MLDQGRSLTLSSPGREQRIDLVEEKRRACLSKIVNMERRKKRERERI